MAEPTIVCPKCNTEIKLTESLAAPLIASTRKHYEQQIAQKDKDISEREQSVRDKEKKLADEKKVIDEIISEKVDERIKLERVSIISTEAKKAKLAAATELEQKVKELADIQDILKQRDEKLAEAQRAQAALLKKQRELDDKERELDLKIEQGIQKVVKETREKAKNEASEEFKLKFAEKDKAITDLQAELQDALRKADQGSQQAQGEILELVLEEELKTYFPLDGIQPVPKGISGADIIQTVNNPHAKTCGSIIWETKRTKNWTDGWIQKLKDDQRSVKADIAIILSQTLPKNVKGFEYVDGVWITDFNSYIGLSTALRMNLIQLYSMKQSNIGKNEKMEVIYNYLSGHEFKQRVQSIVEAFQTMKTDLDKERISMQKHWSKREKEIERVIVGTVGMYGDLEGIIGETLPKIEGIELKVLAAPDDNEDNTS